MNIAAVTEGQIDKALSATVVVGVVQTVVGATVTIKVLGSLYPINQPLVKLASYTAPSPGDAVWVLASGEGYLVLGRIG